MVRDLSVMIRSSSSGGRWVRFTCCSRYSKVSQGESEDLPHPSLSLPLSIIYQVSRKGIDISNIRIRRREMLQEIQQSLAGRIWGSATPLLVSSSLHYIPSLWKEQILFLVPIFAKPFIVQTTPRKMHDVDFDFSQLVHLSCS